jgi:hypothetical protein
LVKRFSNLTHWQFLARHGAPPDQWLDCVGSIGWHPPNYADRSRHDEYDPDYILRRGQP